MPISDAIVAEFKHEADNTRKVLAAVPGDRLDWKPHEKSMSLGQLTGHIAETPGWAPSMMEPELDFTAVDYKPFIAEDSEGLMKNFEDAVKVFEDALSGRDDEFMSQTWTMRAGDKVLMSLPRFAVVKNISINHLVHHRGQLTVYLRLLDVAVPATYGPTADNPEGFG